MNQQETIKDYQDILRQYNILNLISKTVASTLDLNKILKIILTGVTFGDGFGFNRAFLFLIDRTAKNLKGRMAIGPASTEEAWQIWNEILQRNYSLEEFLDSEKFDIQPIYSSLDEKIREITIRLDAGKLLWKCLEDGIPRNIDLTVSGNDKRKFLITDRNLIDQGLIDYIDHTKFCIIPLISRTKKVGILIVDNKYNQRDISENDIKFLLMLSQFAASSIRNTIVYNDLKDSLAALAKLNMKLKYLKEYNENIIESIPVSILVLDYNLKATLCNENCGKLMGLEKHFIIGKQITAHSIYLDGINLVDEIYKVMVDKKAEGFYKVDITINNKKINKIFDIMLIPFRASNENPEGIIIIIEEVTRTVELERALNEAKRLSELGKLSATVAHEIRNPLIAIGGYANRLKKKLKEGLELDKKNLDIIIDEVSRLENIVNEILDFAVDRRIDFEEVNISKLLSECINLARVAAEQNNIGIIFDCNADLIEKDMLFTHGSYNNLKQAFINVLNNAVEASEKRGTVKICVTLEENDIGREVLIRINNRGTFENITDIDNIFLPFYTTKSRGTGLGLTITRRIIEQHAGSIEVESDAEEGITFIIKLPLLKL